jgi:succinate dehydrogenase/fumarate reductase flavoprotein subunit
MTLFQFNQQLTMQWEVFRPDVNGRVLSDHKGGVIEGVYAAGEAACVSVHGANRLGN